MPLAVGMVVVRQEVLQAGAVCASTGANPKTADSKSQQAPVTFMMPSFWNRPAPGYIFT
jgi:hypothetical protein